MTLEKLESRMTALEVELAQLKEKVDAGDRRPWWQKLVGAFAGDPYFEEAMKLGRAYRESLRPKPRKKKKK